MTKQELKAFMADWIGNGFSQLFVMMVVLVASIQFGWIQALPSVFWLLFASSSGAFLLTVWEWLKKADPFDAYPPELGPTGLSDEHEHHHSPRG